MIRYYRIYYRNNLVGTVTAINHAIDKDVTDETYTITLLDDKKHIIALFDSSYKPKVQRIDDVNVKDTFNVYID